MVSFSINPRAALGPCLAAFGCSGVHLELSLLASHPLTAPQVVFQKPLQNLKVEEGSTASLQCELSIPNAAVVWSKGGLELQADERRESRQRGCVAELLLRDVRREDAGEYSCTCGSQSTGATLMVTGRHPRLVSSSVGGWLCGYSFHADSHGCSPVSWVPARRTQLT